MSLLKWLKELVRVEILNNTRKERVIDFKYGFVIGFFSCLLVLCVVQVIREIIN